MMDEQGRELEPGALEMLRGYLRRPAWLLTLLGLTTVVLYSSALFFDFVWDDWPQIVNNPLIRSWSELPRAFGSDLWYHMARHQVYYRPLFVAWSMLNYSLFGLRAWGWHLGAILAHVGATVAMFWLARKLGLEYWTAAIAALIFALHPIHIEPAVWISAASDSMVAMFAALAFVAFLNWRIRGQARRGAWWAASLVFLTCALLTKEMAVTFPVLIGVYAWLHPSAGERSPSKKAQGVFLEAAPYVVLTLAYALLRKHALPHATGQFDPNHGLADVFRTLPLVLAFYLEKLLVPIGLTGLYYTPYVAHTISAKVIVPMLALAFVSLGLWYWNRREGESRVAFAGIWMLAGLAPALYLRNFGNGDFVRDRYIYLPSIGFAMLLAMGLRRLPSIRQWNARVVQVAAVSVLCAGYVVASLAQQVHWASDLLVWSRGEALYPDNPHAAIGLAEEFSKRGAHDRAIELAEAAVRAHPDLSYAPLALAENYISAGRFNEGRYWLQRVSPEYVESEIGMASLAGLYGRMGDVDKALSLCSEILAKEPDLNSALYNCGNIELMDGNYAEAERLLSRAVVLAPQDAGSRHFLGRALLGEGRSNEAERYLREAVAADPSVWDYHYWLGISLEKNGDAAGARMEYEQALRLNRDSGEAKMRLAALEAK